MVHEIHDVRKKVAHAVNYNNDNTHRRHSALGYNSPAQFERVQAAVV